MTENRLDARQSRHRDLLDQLANLVDTPVNTLLTATNKEVTPPLRMSVASPTVLNIDTHLVTNPVTHRSHTIAPINGTFSPIPTYPITVTIPGTNGQNITNSTGSAPVALSISGTSFYRFVGLAINGSGSLSVTLGAEGSSLSSLPYPVFPNGYFAIGMFAVQKNNSNPTFLSLTNANVQQFSGGIAAAILNPMTSAGDIIYGDSIGTPQRLPIGTAGQLFEVTAGGLPGWTSTVHGDKTFNNMLAVQGILKVGTPNIHGNPFNLVVSYPSSASPDFGYVAWIENTSATSGSNGLSVAVAANDAGTTVQRWLRAGTQNIGEILGTGTWHIGSSGGSQSHIVYGTLTVQQGTSTGNQLIVSVGSAATPAITGAADATSGIYFNGTNEIDFAIQGSQVAKYLSSGLVMNSTSITGASTINSTGRITAGNGLTVTTGSVLLNGSTTIQNTVDASLTIKTTVSGHEADLFFINGTGLKWAIYMPNTNNDHLNFYSYTFAGDIMSVQSDGTVRIFAGGLVVSGQLSSTSATLYVPNLPTRSSGTTGMRVVYYENSSGELKIGPTVTIP